VVFGERHLRHVLLSYMSYYNGTRTHLSLNKDAPMQQGNARPKTKYGLSPQPDALMNIKFYRAVFAHL
jgi:hypothetical protein